MDVNKQQRAQFGFSMVELLIVVALTSVILIGVYTTLTTNQNAYVAVQSSQLITSKSRVINSFVRSLIQQTGYRRLFQLQSNMMFQASTPLTGSKFVSEWQANQIIIGRDNTLGVSGVKNGTDIFAFRFFPSGPGQAYANGLQIEADELFSCDGTEYLVGDINTLDSKEVPIMVTLFVNTDSELICVDSINPDKKTIIANDIDDFQVLYNSDTNINYVTADTLTPLTWSSIGKIKLAFLISEEVQRNRTIENTEQTFDVLDEKIKIPGGENKIYQVVTDTITIG